MKSLIDILEKLSIDNIQVNDIEFPIKGDDDTTIDFLKNQGFERLPRKFYGSEQQEFVYIFNSQHTRGWMSYLGGDFTMITFADTTDKEISKDNLMIQICFQKGKPTEWIAVSGRYAEKHCTEREFLDILKKQFSWG